MIHFVGESGSELCDRIPRRRWLSLGTLAALGSVLPPRAKNANAQEQARAPVPGTPFGKAKACVQIFLWGGPGAQETWDLKPHAPSATRGEFRPISTNVSGIQYCEHLPEMSRRADKYTIIRSLSHTGVNHGTSAYHMLTGHIHSNPGTLRHPEKTDMPNLGANLGRYLRTVHSMPSHVHLPAIINDGDGLPVPGQDAGILGERFAPFQVLGDLTKKDFRVASLAAPPGMDQARLQDRFSLWKTLNQQQGTLADEVRSTMGESYLKAIELLDSSNTQKAFNLGDEPAEIRERYGMHHFAQALVLTRRLLEAGVPMITVYWSSPSNSDNQSWDTHNNQHERMSKHLLPAFDRAMSAFLDELFERGLIDDTIVTWYGEFGRTPKINSGGGRDHWGFCQSIGITGGPMIRGQVYGSSTADGGYPDTLPVKPDDLAATLFFGLGIDHRQHMFDLQGRPIQLSFGEPVHALFS